MKSISRMAEVTKLGDNWLEERTLSLCLSFYFVSDFEWWCRNDPDKQIIKIEEFRFYLVSIRNVWKFPVRIVMDFL